VSAPTKRPALRAEIGHSLNVGVTINLYAVASYRGVIAEALDEEVAEITAELTARGIKHNVHPAGGVIYVPSSWKSEVEDLCHRRGLIELLSVNGDLITREEQERRANGPRPSDATIAGILGRPQDCGHVSKSKVLHGDELLCSKCVARRKKRTKKREAGEAA
jgi:hypothetical protein